MPTYIINPTTKAKTLVPNKDYSNGATPSKPDCSAIQAQLTKALAQRDAMAEALRSIKDCKSIVEVRKCIVHAQEVYPR